VRCLEPVERFASRWQRDHWCLGWMARQLDIEVIELNGGRGLLGLLAGDRAHRVIAVNRRLATAGLDLAVVAHELAHLLLGHASPCVCRAARHLAPAERLAWYGAARLVVSGDHLAGLATGRLDPAEIAAMSGVPVELVRLGCTLGDTTRPDLRQSALSHWSAELWGRLRRLQVA
jgi:IrrE N-terminal-like domain